METDVYSASIERVNPKGALIQLGTKKFFSKRHYLYRANKSTSDKYKFSLNGPTRDILKRKMVATIISKIALFSYEVIYYGLQGLLTKITRTT